MLPLRPAIDLLKDRPKRLAVGNFGLEHFGQDFVPVLTHCRHIPLCKRQHHLGLAIALILRALPLLAGGT